MLLCSSMSCTALLIAGLLVMATSVQSAADQTDAKQLSQQADRRRRELQAEADSLAKQAATLLVELRRLEIDRQLRAEDVKKADAAVLDIDQRISATTQRIKSLEAMRQAATPWVRERLVAIYKRGRPGYLSHLFSVDDFRSIGRITRGVASIAAIERARLEEHRRTLQQERAALTELEQQRKTAATARADALKARVALDQAVAAHTRRLDDLDRQRDLAARYIGELQAAQSDLQKSIAAMPGTAPVLPIGPFRGTLEWPAAGRILSRFGRSTADRFGTSVVRNGIEISVGEGAPVRAVHDGVVAFAAPFRGFGTAHHPRSRTKRVHALWTSRPGGSDEWSTGGTKRGGRAGGTDARWRAGGLFRAQDRRPPSRSRTMA